MSMWTRHQLVTALLILGLAIGATSCGGIGPLACVGVQCQKQKTQLKTPLATPAPSPVAVTEFHLPSANTYLGAVTTGPDGNLWVTECDANSIARVTPAGTITEFPIPTASTCPQIITPGPPADNTLWFTETDFSTIGRITTAGVITEFPLPPPLASATNNPTGIALGPDGNLWFSDPLENVVGVMSTSGTLVATYPTKGEPDIIISGPNNSMWFGEDPGAANYIGNVTMSGTVTEYQVPTFSTNGTGGTIGGLVVGQDGNVWFTEKVVGIYSRITPAGAITEYGPYSTGPWRFQRVTTTPDGFLWIAEESTYLTTASEIAKVDTLGALIAEYTIPEPVCVAGIFCGVRSLTVGPDHNLWFTDEGNDAVGYITPGARSSVARRKP